MTKRAVLLLIILINIIFILDAQIADGGQNRWPLKLYNENFIITGVGDDQVKIALSIMYDMFYPHKIGLFLGYSQIMFWELYNTSSPFSEINFNPDLFWRFESKNNFLKDLDLLFVDYFQLGLYEHSSNGEDGKYSRSLNRSYIQVQLSTGSFVNAGLNIKYNFYYDQANSGNDDYTDYVGPFAGKFFINFNNGSKKDRCQIYARFGIGKNTKGNWSLLDGWQEYGFQTCVLFSYIRLYAQVYHGYGESLLNYNVMTNNSLTGVPFAIRAGFALDLPD